MVSRSLERDKAGESHQEEQRRTWRVKKGFKRDKARTSDQVWERSTWRFKKSFKRDNAGELDQEGERRTWCQEEFLETRRENQIKMERRTLYQKRVSRDKAGESIRDGRGGRGVNCQEFRETKGKN